MDVLSFYGSAAGPLFIRSGLSFIHDHCMRLSLSLINIDRGRFATSASASFSLSPSLLSWLPKLAARSSIQRAQKVFACVTHMDR